MSPVSAPDFEPGVAGLPPHLASLWGFRSGERGTHTSRTIMLDELSLLLAAVPGAAVSRRDYAEAVLDGNCLGKRTAATRKLSLQGTSQNPIQVSGPFRNSLNLMNQRDHNGNPKAISRTSLQRLTELYGLDTRLLLFRSCGALPRRIRLSSSRNVTSNPQCSSFSIPQCERTSRPNDSTSSSSGAVRLASDSISLPPSCALSNQGPFPPPALPGFITPSHRSASVHVVASIDRSDCYRPERQLPGGIRTRQSRAPCTAHCNLQVESRSERRDSQPAFPTRSRLRTRIRRCRPR